ncbi:MAG TPA: cell division protein ZapA [Candidatus Krumholzibacteria bacterium]|nr:cell division protein ZapA [Candidatus Krumholzibacteria bacterium]
MNDSMTATVEILGREYKIRGAADAAYISEVARYVDSKLREVSQGGVAPPPDRVAIIAAMNIADELFQLKRSHSEEFSTIEKRAQSLIRMLDESLSPAKREAVASSAK